MGLGNSLGLKTKVATPLIVSAVGLILIGIIALVTIKDLTEDVDHLSAKFLPAVSESLNGDRDLYQAYVAQLKLIEAASRGRDTSGHLESFEENAQQALDRLSSAAKRLEGTGVSDKFSGFKSSFDGWYSSAKRSIELAKSGDNEGAERIRDNDSGPAFDALRDYFDLVGAHADDQAVMVAEGGAEEGRNSTVLVVVVTLAALAASILLLLLFLKLVVQSVQRLRSQLDDIAQGEGDLTTRIPVDTEDDLGQLANSFNAVLANLQEMIREIQSVNADLNTGAEELARSARDNEDGANRQNDLVSSVAAAINEMHSAIEEVAGSATRASEVTDDARSTAENGAGIIRNSSEHVQQLASQIAKAVDVIRKLAEDSENITSVLDVIRGIAEQTNLLALNAAIEAARAGEQGRGFAVVADEVRTLAQRTQQSTEDIQKMITALQTGVSEVVQVMETGSTQATETESLAAQAETELKAILESMNSISDMNASVATAMEEQTAVVDEINRNITNISELSNETTRRSVTIGEISQNLDQSAQSLAAQTGRFKA